MGCVRATGVSRGSYSKVHEFSFTSVGSPVSRDKILIWPKFPGSQRVKKQWYKEGRFCSRFVPLIPQLLANDCKHKGTIILALNMTLT